MPDAQPIVIAYDGSDAARAAVNEAAALFGLFQASGQGAKDYSAIIQMLRGAATA